METRNSATARSGRPLATHQGPQLSSYGGLSSFPHPQSAERNSRSQWGAYHEDVGRPAAGYDSRHVSGKDGKGGKGQSSTGGWSGQAFHQPERKPRGSGGIIAELTSDGRLGSGARQPSYPTASYPSHSDHFSQSLADQRYGYSYRASEPDDDWAKNPDIFSSANHAFEPQPHEAGKGTNQPTKTAYAGIAAELTNDGRLRADWWASEGHSFEASHRKGDPAAWRREWTGGEGGARSQGSYGWPSGGKGKGKHGKSKKGKDKAPSLDGWYGWSKNEQVESWHKGSTDPRAPDPRAPAYSHGAERLQEMEEQYSGWHAGQADELRNPHQEIGLDPKRQRRRKKKKKAPLEEPNTMSPEEREVLARARREELSAEKEAEAEGAPRLLDSMKDWDEVLADEHLRSWMSIYRSNPAVLEDDFQMLMDRSPWKETGTSEVSEKMAWMVAPEFQFGRRCHHRTFEPVVMPDWMSDLTDRWLRLLRLERDQLPNSVEVTWFDHGTRDARWLCDDESLFRTDTQDTRVICITLGPPRIFRAGLRCGTRKTPVRGTVSEVRLSHGDTCLIEGRYQKHFVHQFVGQEVENESSSSRGGYLHVSFRWIVKQSRNFPLHEQGASEEPSEEDASSGSAASDDLGDVE